MSDSSAAWLIAGLGNPGADYVGTRHNAGFMAADLIAGEIGANYWKSECGSLVASKSWHGMDIVIAKPQTFMNLSGSACSQLLRRSGIDLSHMIVVHDDLDLPEGMVRIKSGGGHGGHNGLRSIIDKAGSNAFIRIKIGIGRPPGRMPVVDYVLQRPKGRQEEEFLSGIAEASDAALYLMDHGVQDAQSRFNQKAC